MKIGVVIMLAELDFLKRAMRFEEIRDTAIGIEAMGFDSLWVYDHLLYRSKQEKTTGIWEGWSTLSALAAITRRVELGTLVACNSFRNPALLAKMAHTLDEISAGRLILGIGAGWNEPEYDAFGYPFDHRVDRFEEALKIIHPLLKTGCVDFEGQYYRARNCEITPRSPRPGGPPLLVGGFGPRMLRLTAQYADLWNWGYLSMPRALVKPRKALLKACAQVGRDPATLPVTVLASLAYPDLMGKTKPTLRGNLTGTAEAIAGALAELDGMGVVHLMFHVKPATMEAYGRLADAVRIWKENK